MLTAVGGSLIKPSIVGTVARTSPPDLKSMGYSIYYTLVNIGGALGPILALGVRKNLGIEYVLVNGIPIVSRGQPVEGVTPGRAVRAGIR